MATCVLLFIIVIWNAEWAGYHTISTFDNCTQEKREKHYYMAIMNNIPDGCLPKKIATDRKIRAQIYGDEKLKSSSSSYFAFAGKRILSLCHVCVCVMDMVKNTHMNGKTKYTMIIMIIIIVPLPLQTK